MHIRTLFYFFNYFFSIFATLEKRGKLVRVNFRKDSWDCSEGQGQKLTNSWQARPRSQKQLRNEFQFQFPSRTSSGEYSCVCRRCDRFIACEQALRGALTAGWEKEEELATTSLKFKFHLQFPVTPRRLSCQISANQREAETSANVNKHWKTSAKGNDVITNVISANQHFAPTLSMPIFKFQRRSCKLSFLFPPGRQSAPESLLAGYRFVVAILYLSAGSLLMCFMFCFRNSDYVIFSRKFSFFSFHIHMNVHPRA